MLGTLLADSEYPSVRYLSHFLLASLSLKDFMCYDVGLFVRGSVELFYVSESSGWSDLFSS